MFSRDAAKSLKNYEQHGVSFEEAATAFDDPNALEVEDLEHLDALEQRWKRLGFSIRHRLLLVIYTLRRLKKWRRNDPHHQRASSHTARAQSICRTVNSTSPTSRK
jgi:uncharacterized protein